MSENNLTPRQHYEQSANELRVVWLRLNRPESELENFLSKIKADSQNSQKQDDKLYVSMKQAVDAELKFSKHALLDRDGRDLAKDKIAEFYASMPLAPLRAADKALKQIVSDLAKANGETSRDEKVIVDLEKRKLAAEKLKTKIDADTKEKQREFAEKKEIYDSHLAKLKESYPEKDRSEIERASNAHVGKYLKETPGMAVAFVTNTVFDDVQKVNYENTWKSWDKSQKNFGKSTISKYQTGFALGAAALGTYAALSARSSTPTSSDQQENAGEVRSGGWKKVIAVALGVIGGALLLDKFGLEGKGMRWVDKEILRRVQPYSGPGPKI